MKLSVAIKKARGKLTQVQLARRTFVSISTIVRAERGLDPGPKLVAWIIKVTGAKWLKRIYCNEFCPLCKEEQSTCRQAQYSAQEVAY